MFFCQNSCKQYPYATLLAQCALFGTLPSAVLQWREVASIAVATAGAEVAMALAAVPIIAVKMDPFEPVVWDIRRITIMAAMTVCPLALPDNTRW